MGGGTTGLSIFMKRHMIYADAVEPTALWNDGDTWSVVDSLGRLMTKVRPQVSIFLAEVVAALLARQGLAWSRSAALAMLVLGAVPTVWRVMRVRRQTSPGTLRLQSAKSPDSKQ